MAVKENVFRKVVKHKTTKLEKQKSKNLKATNSQRPSIMGSRISTPTVNNTQQACLLQPAMDGDLEKVKQLIGVFLASISYTNVGFIIPPDPKLRDYVNINQVDSQGNTAMHCAVFAGHIDICQYLHESCGASLHQPNTLGCSPVWLAAAYNRINVLDYILTKCSNPKEELQQTNHNGDTCMIAAASRGNIEACQILIQKAILLDFLIPLMDTTNQGGDTPLSVAIAGNHSILLNLLLQHTSTVVINQPNRKGVTPLLIACERDDVTACQQLLQFGAMLDVIDTVTGASPLAVAAFCGSDQVMDILLQADTTLQHLEQSNYNACTPLWLATRAGRDKIVKRLLDAGADPLKKNKNGLSAIDVAIKFKRESISDLFNHYTITSNA